MEPPFPVRHHTRASIDFIANRLDLPNEPGMQDWEFEVADSDLIDDLMMEYELAKNNSDVRFTLMDIMIQSFEELDDISRDPRWLTICNWLDQHFEDHKYQVWYWSCLESSSPRDCWDVTKDIRRIWFDKQHLYSD